VLVFDVILDPMVKLETLSFWSEKFMHLKAKIEK